MAFEVHFQLLVTDNVGNISKHMLLLKGFLNSLGVMLNVHEYLIVSRIDHLQVLHDKQKNDHKNRSWRGNH